MVVIIPLRNQSKNNYYELRFALRSICIHNPIERCLLVGGKPEWYTGEHIQHVDYVSEFKEQNIRDKTVTAARIIKGDFLFANDDHFLLTPYTGVHNKGLLSDTLKNRQPNGSYTRLLQNTLSYFGDVENVDTHCPMLMNSEGVERTVFDWPKWGLGFKTTYAQVNKIPSVYHPDQKVADVSQVKDGLYFSTYEGAKNLTLLLDMFPVKSIFEK